MPPRTALLLYIPASGSLEMAGERRELSGHVMRACACQREPRRGRLETSHAPVSALSADAAIGLQSKDSTQGTRFTTTTHE